MEGAEAESLKWKGAVGSVRSCVVVGTAYDSA
jgi:hypothetical protein